MATLIGRAFTAIQQDRDIDAVVSIVLLVVLSQALRAALPAYA